MPEECLWNMEYCLKIWRGEEEYMGMHGTDNRMKVAFLTPGTSPVPATKGGAVENLIEDLLDENEQSCYFDFSVLSLYEEEAFEKSERYKNSEFCFVKCPDIVKKIDKCIYWIAKNILKKKNLISYRFILQRLYVMSKFPGILLKNDFDRIVLVTNSTLFFVLKNKRIAEKYQGKVIYYLHNEVRSLFKCENEVASIKKLIGVSNFVNKSFRKMIPSLIDEQCFVLKNGVDTEKFGFRDEAKINYYQHRYGITENDFVVIFAGRLVAEKGALETIKAIKICKDKHIKLLIVGAGFYSSDVVDDYTLELQREVEEIKDRVIFTGYIDYGDMPSIYQLGNVAVLPSMWEEPAGMTMVEAVVSGLPLITTKSGGIPEYISNKLAIILTRDEKLIENIARGIMDIKQNKSAVDKVAVADFCNEISLKNYYQKFTEILNDGN